MISTHFIFTTPLLFFITFHFQAKISILMSFLYSHKIFSAFTSIMKKLSNIAKKQLLILIVQLFSINPYLYLEIAHLMQPH